MIKKKLSAQQAKGKIMESIYNNVLLTMLERSGVNASEHLSMRANSIIFLPPKNFFSQYEIPENLQIEMKFVVNR